MTEKEIINIFTLIAYTAAMLMVGIIIGVII
jgi:hypothetical protein